MNKIYCFIFGKYRKFEKPKMSHILEKTFKDEESIGILKILGLIENA